MSTHKKRPTSACPLAKPVSLIHTFSSRPAITGHGDAFCSLPSAVAVAASLPCPLSTQHSHGEGRGVGEKVGLAAWVPSRLQISRIYQERLEVGGGGRGGGGRQSPLVDTFFSFCFCSSLLFFSIQERVGK